MCVGFFAAFLAQQWAVLAVIWVAALGAYYVTGNTHKSTIKTEKKDIKIPTRFGRFG